MNHVWKTICVMIAGLGLSVGSAHAAERKVAPSPEQICPILTGMKAPEVEFLKTDGTRTNLSTFLQLGPALLIFYRGGW